jgi:hypothetical protein
MTIAARLNENIISVPNSYKRPRAYCGARLHHPMTREYFLDVFCVSRLRVVFDTAIAEGGRKKGEVGHRRHHLSEPDGCRRRGTPRLAISDNPGLNETAHCVRVKCIRSGCENLLLAITTAHGVPCHHGNTGCITLCHLGTDTTHSASLYSGTGDACGRLRKWDAGVGRLARLYAGLQSRRVNFEPATQMRARAPQNQSQEKV